MVCGAEDPPECVVSPSVLCNSPFSSCAVLILPSYTSSAVCTLLEWLLAFVDLIDILELLELFVSAKVER